MIEYRLEDFFNNPSAQKDILTWRLTVDNAILHKSVENATEVAVHKDLLLVAQVDRAVALKLNSRSAVPDHVYMSATPCTRIDMQNANERKKLHHDHFVFQRSRRSKAYSSYLDDYVNTTGRNIKVQCRAGTLRTASNVAELLGHGLPLFSACKLCNDHDPMSNRQLDSVAHFVGECPAFAEHRANLAKRIQMTLDDQTWSAGLTSIKDKIKLISDIARIKEVMATDWITLILGSFDRLVSLPKTLVFKLNRLIHNFLTVSWKMHCKCWPFTTKWQNRTSAFPGRFTLTRYAIAS